MAGGNNDRSANAHHKPLPINTQKLQIKSRNGCCNCKRRKIKCDEGKPMCGRCAHLALPCSYSTSSMGVCAAIFGKRGRPSKRWTVVSVGQGHVEDAKIPTTLSPSMASVVPLRKHDLGPSLHLRWNVADIELFNHYMTRVAADGQGMHLWRSQLPHLAFRCHNILHLLLALSALHLSRISPERTLELVERADIHMAIALRQTTQALQVVGEHNCAEVYIATVLICTCTFAKQPGPRHLLVVAEGQEVAWWELFRGVRIVVESIGMTKILSNLASAGGPETVSKRTEDEATSHNKEAFITLDVLELESALDSLSFVVEQAPGEQKSVLQKTFGMLKWCFQDTFGTSADPKLTADVKLQTIMAWLYVLDDEYVNMLKENEPIALALLAHFAVLLQVLDSVWFFEGWATHIMRGISEILVSPLHVQWIQWPWMQLEKPRHSLGSQK